MCSVTGHPVPQNVQVDLVARPAHGPGFGRSITAERAAVGHVDTHWPHDSHGVSASGLSSPGFI